MQELDNEHTLFQELCYISNERNNINHLRSKARWRKAYWTNALKIVEAHKGINSKLRKLSPDRHAKVIQQIKHEMACIRLSNPNPKKWMAMGLLKIRANILKAEAEYAQSKHDTLIFTEKHNSRNKQLSTILGVRLRYVNGYVESIITFRSETFYQAIGRQKIKEIAEQYELNKVVEEVILNEKVLST